MDADTNFMSSSLLKLVENEFQSDNSWKYSSIGRWYLGASESADGIAIVKVLVKTSYPFASGNRISKCCSKTGGAELRKGRDGEQFSNKGRIIISTLKKGQIKKLISEIRVDRWIKAVDVKAKTEDRSERSMISHLEIQDIRHNVSSGEATKEEREASETSMQVLIRARVNVIKNERNLSDRPDGNAIDGKEKGAS
jgi:hypothetical protein